jgi:hypothetical protein
MDWAMVNSPTQPWGCADAGTDKASIHKKKAAAATPAALLWIALLFRYICIIVASLSWLPLEIVLGYGDVEGL